MLIHVSTRIRLMQAMIKKWGNSASIRIPTPILAEVGLTLDSPVEIFVLDGQIIIDPTQKNDLDMLIAAISEDNLHQEIDFGIAVGQEEF